MAFMKFVLFLLCASAMKLKNDLKSLVAIELEPFAEMKMRFISPKMPNRIYKNMNPNEHGIALFAKYGKYWLEDRYGLLDKIGTNVCITGDSFAANNGHSEVVKFLNAMNTVANLANDDDTHSFRDRVVKNNKWTPLRIHARIAAYKGHRKIVEFLEAEGVDVDCNRNWLHLTPVSIAAREGHTEIVKFLAKKRVDLNRHCSPVSYAAESGHTEIVKFLAVRMWTQKNISKHMLMLLLATAVQAATKFGHMEIVKFLIEFLASKNANMDLDRLIIIAEEYGHIQVVEFLSKKKAKEEEEMLKIATMTEMELKKVQDNFLDAVRQGRLKLVEDLVETVNLSEKYGFGYTAIYAAVESGQPRVVDFLISKNVKLDENLLEIAKTKNIKRKIADALKYM